MFPSEDMLISVTFFIPPIYLIAIVIIIHDTVMQTYVCVTHSTSALHLRNFTSVPMKNTIFWDILSCSPLKVNRRFGGTHRILFQGRRISQARFQLENRWETQQSASRNFGLYRKQEGNGRVDFSSD
jgi:hypothetical protein